MNEIWKDIKGYEGKYMVSSFGRIKSLQRIVLRSNSIGCLPLKERMIKIIPDPNNYLRAAFCRNGETKTIRIHRLVAESFLPNPFNKPQVNHKDGNRQNNNVENLEWCTQSENMIHANSTGLKKVASGSSHAYSRPVIDLNTGVFYDSVTDLAKLLCMPAPTLRDWLNGKTNKGNNYKYA